MNKFLKKTIIGALVIISALVVIYVVYSSRHSALQQERFYVSGTELRDASSSEPLFLRGIVYSPYYQGEKGGDILPDDSRYDDHLQKISALGANVVSVFPEKMPAGFFSALEENNLLYAPIINLTLYDGTDNSDLLAEDYQRKVLAHIQEIIDYNYKVGNPDRLVYFALGYEINNQAILNTNRLHGETKSFSGKYVKLQNRQPAEIALAKILDEAISYEVNTYKRRHLYTHISYPAYGLMKLKNSSYARSASAFFPDFFDLFAINSYPSYFYDSSDAYLEEEQLFANPSGYTEYFAALSREVNKPIVISELGLPSSGGDRLLVTAAGVPAYGKNTEEDAAKLFRRAYRDIVNVKISGLFFFEFMDEYWKNGEEVDDAGYHNPQDKEEWFGIYSPDNSGTSSQTLRPKERIITTIKEIFSGKIPQAPKKEPLLGEGGIILYGDPGPNDEVHRLIVSGISRFAPKYVFLAGDLVTNGNIKEQYDNFNAITAPLRKTAEIYTAIGNHDEESQFYYDNFRFPGNEKWYTLDIDGAHFIFLDTNISLEPDSEQYVFLEEKLKSYSKESLVAVIMHKPLYSIGFHASDDNSAREGLISLMQKYDVEAVFSGHEHDYERLNIGGLYQIVSGGGGSPLRDKAADNKYLEKFVKSYNFVRIEVMEGSFNLTAYDDKLLIIDEISID